MLCQARFLSNLNHGVGLKSVAMSYRSVPIQVIADRSDRTVVATAGQVFNHAWHICRMWLSVDKQGDGESNGAVCFFVQSVSATLNTDGLDFPALTSAFDLSSRGGANDYRPRSVWT